MIIPALPLIFSFSTLADLGLGLTRPAPLLPLSLLQECFLLSKLALHDTFSVELGPEITELESVSETLRSRITVSSHDDS